MIRNFALFWLLTLMPCGAQSVHFDEKKIQKQKTTSAFDLTYYIVSAK